MRRPLFKIKNGMASFSFGLNKKGFLLLFFQYEQKITKNRVVRMNNFIVYIPASYK
jgi:hypothetical protein